MVIMQKSLIIWSTIKASWVRRCSRNVIRKGYSENIIKFKLLNCLNTLLLAKFLVSLIKMDFFMQII